MSLLVFAQVATSPASAATKVHMIADGALMAACLGIAVTLFVLAHRRPGPGVRQIFFRFGCFFASVGLACAGELWSPWPWVTIAFHFSAVGAAMAGGVLLYRMVPALVSMPSRVELQRLNVNLEERVVSRTSELTQANERLRNEAAQREQAEAEVRRLNAELEARLGEVETLFKLLPVAVGISTDPSGRRLRANHAFSILFGVPSRSGALSAAPMEAPATYRLLHEGVELKPEEQPLQRAALRNEPVHDFSGTIIRQDGTAVEVIAHAVPLRDAEGRAQGSVATFQDITAHKQAERQRLDFERKLLQSQKMEGIGMLAGGVAHDFNNILTGILGHANLARAELARGSTRIDHLLAQVETSAQRAATLCRQLLAYAGKGRFVVRPVDLNGLIEQSLPLLRLSMVKKFTLDLQLAPGLPQFTADATQINQALMNLVANASEAMTTDTGIVSLRTECVNLSPMDMLTLNSTHEMEPGNFLCLAVSDTGRGIPIEAMGSIFEPFFTTKFVGRGLGLSAVLGIVNGHHGGIRVTSQVGVGSCFELFFPVARAPVQPAPPAPPPASGRLLPAQRGAILVGDDDEAVRTFAATALQSAGYTVTTAVDGEDVVNTIRRGPLRFDAVLLDLSMPKLSGEDTMMALRMLAPGLPVVLTSGYSEQAVAERFVGRGMAAFLPKPFIAQALVESLDRAIAKARSSAPGSPTR